MLTLLLSSPILFLVAGIGLVIALTIHEFAHALMADKLGDPTPRLQGRVTINPLAHLDPLGTLALLLTGFGWGKPVIFDPYNLRDAVRDSALIALAGPLSNMLMAVALAILIQSGFLAPLLSAALTQVLIINIVLAVFNLVPVYPLDGSKIIVALLPQESALEYERFMQSYGLMVLILLLIPWSGVSPISQVVGPLVEIVTNILIR